MRWAWHRAKPELDKCILVCANRHAEIHYPSKDSSIERTINPLPLLEIECRKCKIKFLTKDKDRLYCSSDCRIMGQRKVERPDFETLKDLIDKKIPFTKLGSMFGVSDNAVRKWAKKYKIL
jgi:hypothetical protein